MLEIIILYLLCRQIGKTARKKGEKPLHWQLYVIGGWLLAELTGVWLIMSFFGLKLWLIVVFGFGLGYCSFLAIRHRLENMPDQTPEAPEG